MSNRPESCSTVARRRSIPEAKVRDRDEHDQRQGSAGEGVEEVQRLERAEAMDGCDDEAGHRRAATNAEVARNSAEREQGRALLGCDQGEAQNSVRGIRDSEPGAADDRTGEGLPGTVDECEARIAEAAARLPAIRIGFARKRSTSAPEGGVATAAVPKAAATTSPAVAVAKPRAWCR